MGKGQTLFRILLIVLLFGALAVFKLDLNPEAWFKDPSSTPAGLKSRVHKGTPQDVDFKTIHRVKITRAKVRKDPSAKAPVLLVLKKDTRVNILEGNEDWWKITVKGKTGWVSKTDLDSEIR